LVATVVELHSAAFVGHLTQDEVLLTVTFQYPVKQLVGLSAAVHVFVPDPQATHALLLTKYPSLQPPDVTPETSHAFAFAGHAVQVSVVL